MTQKSPSKFPPVLLHRMILIVILMCVVIGLVIAVIALPGFNIPAVPTPVPTLPSGEAAAVSTAQLTEMAAPTLPPVVRVESIVITGGALGLIVLGLILREILLYRKRVSQKEGDGQNPAVLKK